MQNCDMNKILYCCIFQWKLDCDFVCCLFMVNKLLVDEYKMYEKRTIDKTLIFILLESNFVFVSCKNKDIKSVRHI